MFCWNLRNFILNFPFGLGSPWKADDESEIWETKFSVKHLSKNDQEVSHGVSSVL